MIPTFSDAIRNCKNGMDRAEAGASDEWKAYALGFIAEFSPTLKNFTTDDLWDAGMIKPLEPRALGPVLRRAVKHGLIAKTGEYRKSRYRNCAPLTVWTAE